MKDKLTTNADTEQVAPPEANGEGLGEVAFVRWIVCRKAILPNPCYKLAAVNYHKTKNEALNKKN